MRKKVGPSRKIRAPAVGWPWCPRGYTISPTHARNFFNNSKGELKNYYFWKQTIRFYLFCEKIVLSGTTTWKPWCVNNIFFVTPSQIIKEIGRVVSKIQTLICQNRSIPAPHCFEILKHPSQLLHILPLCFFCQIWDFENQEFSPTLITRLIVHMICTYIDIFICVHVCTAMFACLYNQS